MTLAAERSASGGACLTGQVDAAAPAVRAPVVSIIIPARDAADTLGAALQSLAMQRGVAWEAIVIDDGSTDSTAAVVDKWRARDARLRLIRQQAPRGVSASRNAGLAVARGEWAGFLDADDWLAPGALARLLALGRRRPDAAVLVGEAARVSKAGRTWAYPSRDLSDPFPVLSTHCALPIHSALVRRSVVSAVGGFDESLRSSEDWDLWQRIARAGHRFAQTHERVALYRARPGSLSRNLPQAAEQGLLVMRQAHAPDPRMPADAPNAQGAPPDALAAHELYYVLWSAGRDIAAGGDGVATAALLPRHVSIDFEPNALGELVASGMADMLACRPTELAPRWPEFEPKLRTVFDQVYPEPARMRLKALAIGVMKARLNGGVASDPDVVQVDGALQPFEPSEDYAVLQLRRGDATLAAIALPTLGARSVEELAEAIARQTQRAPLTAAIHAYRPWRRPAFWRAAARAGARLRGNGLKVLAREPRRLRDFLRQRIRFAAAAGLYGALAADLRRARGDAASEHQRQLRALTPPTQEGASRVGGMPASARGTDPERGESWDRFYAVEDPWNCADSAYEQLKLADTLELIAPSPAAEALELACGEGQLTASLAERVGTLLATDISARALERAAGRCADLANVAFRPLDFLRTPLPSRYDLIVCSEALYYMEGRMPEVARKLAAALKPGGLLVTANGVQIVDEPDATGFDWGHSYGALSIGEAFVKIPGMRLEREIHRELYRVQAFRKGEPAHEPRVERRPLDVPLERSVARDVVWGGGESRLASYGREATTQVPILMYHRVSPAPGPAALERYRAEPEIFAEQMSWLRRHGYWGVTPEELADAMAANRPLPGRPVMITFDDGYVDFAEHAWPVLQKHDMRAVMFVVAGKAGGAADWDSDQGEPAPLLPWRQIERLSREGLVVESHSFTHRPLTRLPVAEVYREILETGAAIADRTGRSPVSICYPYGAVDPVVERIAEECGCRLGFATSPAVAALGDNPFRLPRVEVAIHDDLTSFRRKLGGAATG